MEPYIAMAEHSSAAGISLLLLIALLVQREFVICIADKRAHNITQALTIALLPLVIISTCVVVLGIGEVLR